MSRNSYLSHPREDGSQGEKDMVTSGSGLGHWARSVWEDKEWVNCVLKFIAHASSKEGQLNSQRRKGGG